MTQSYIAFDCEFAWRADWHAAHLSMDPSSQRRSISVSAYLPFATSNAATWNGNFRDLSASITRMATLSPDGRINEATVAAEIVRLGRLWHGDGGRSDGNVLAEVLPEAAIVRIDPFDREQLSHVISICRRSASLSAAGRELFAVSRGERKSTNDADRLRKYLARFGLTWDDVG